jgi:hypothetical protein
MSNCIAIRPAGKAVLFLEALVVARVEKGTIEATVIKTE